MAGLLDFLQSASNAAASNVSGPIDGLAWLLRKAGLPVPEDSVGSSAWMEKKGLTKPVQHGAASLLGETAGLLGPTVLAAKAPQVAKGLLQMGENAAAPRTLNPEKGAIVWHGSPHKFDKFDASKIGTGEGAQAYGHGLYLAENPAVAEGYRKGGHVNPDVLLDGEGVLNWVLGKRDVASKMPMDQQRALRLIIDHKDIAQARQAAQMDGLDGAVKYIDELASSGRLKPGNPGSLYKVDLPDPAIARMLDWDKPLSQQAPAVQKALEESLHPTVGHWAQNSMTNPAYNGADLWARLSSKNKNGAAELLRQQGIPGIRYLDGGSRGAGAGTSNFVVFPGEEGLLKILERNGMGL